MLQNSKVTALTVFELLRENQPGEVKLRPPPPPTQIRVKGAISGLTQFLETESPLKMMKKVFCCVTLKALFVLKIFKYLS